ncbi:MAG: glycosyl transferase [Elusimicrobia bacterium CG03_land_8_20_14_0_80_50_18]|nr:MAG: glycosyl transferase [Elusimicrobia bacterium CG03_land_8_20_14_0_80_50_18]
MPHISVIITTYNRKDFAAEAVESVRKQTCSDYELIIVDDGSTDGSREILGPKADKYIFQKNAGVSAARNAGFTASSGKYICFLDSDDLWMKDKLDVQIDFMEKNPSMPLCYTGEKWLKCGSHKNQKKHHSKRGGDIFVKCLEMCIISPSSAMIRRETLERLKFDEKLPVCEDYDMWLRISSEHNIAYIDRELIIKRGGHPGQLSESEPAMDRFRIYSIIKALKSGLSPEREKLAKAELRRKCAIVRSGALKRFKPWLWAKYGLISKFYGS